jgi:hypothetical protein
MLPRWCEWGYVWTWVPGGALNLTSTGYPDHGHHGDLQTWENSHGWTRNHTRDLMVSSQDFWPSSHEAVHFCYSNGINSRSLPLQQKLFQRQWQVFNILIYSFSLLFVSVQLQYYQYPAVCISLWVLSRNFIHLDDLMTEKMSHFDTHLSPLNMKWTEVKLSSQFCFVPAHAPVRSGQSERYAGPSWAVSCWHIQWVLKYYVLST